MKKEFVLALIIVLLAIVTVTYSFDKKYPTYLGGENLLGNKNIITHVIEIRASEFYPPSLTVARGEKIIWVNKDTSPHTVTTRNSTELSSGIIPPNETYYHVFETEGKFKYNCSLRPILSGEVIVGPERDN